MSMMIRLARPSDLATIRRLHDQQNAAQGTLTALPQLFDVDGEFARNIAMAFMVEREGLPVQAFWFVTVPEVCFAGCDGNATAYAQREINRISFALRAMGYSGINCKVPEPMGDLIRPFLEEAGFEDETTTFVHFFKDLRLPTRAEGEDQ